MSTICETAKKKRKKKKKKASELQKYEICSEHHNVMIFISEALLYSGSRKYFTAR